MTGTAAAQVTGAGAGGPAGALAAALPELVARHGWSAAELAAHRTTALRAALAHAAERSAWHGARLRAVDLDAIDASDLTALPTMTKADLMASWDDIVTDGRVSLDLARQHLREVDEHGFALLLGEHLVFTSGGSTGEPGVFCWSLPEMGRWGASTMRWAAGAGQPPTGRTAWVCARSLRHPSGAGAILSGGSLELSVPVDQPLADIVARLNDLQPDGLQVLCSMLPALVDAAEAGELRLGLQRINVFGDVLDPVARRRAEAVFGVAPLEGYPTTDVGHVAQQAPGEDGLYVNDDLLIVEALDADGRPVAPGVASDHLLVTSLHQRTLPLVRYRIDDRVVLAPEPGRHHPFGRIAAVDGRSDDVFRYREVVVHPHVFRSALTAHPAIDDYQVVQRGRGAELRVHAGPALDREALAGDVRAALQRAGLPDPDVTVVEVEHLDRTAAGKRPRFLPLPSDGR